MNKKQTRTLDAIFEDPVPADVHWRDVESLLIALGAELTEGRGSRIRVALNGIRAVFHKPHPEKEVGKSAVRSIPAFLIEAGVQNE
jgi:HicA toxin of bacterial toxin-antitoxin,